MNLLSTILPGLREFRVPFSVGLTWLTTLAVIAVGYPNLAKTTA